MTAKWNQERHAAAKALVSKDSQPDGMSTLTWVTLIIAHLRVALDALESQQAELQAARRLLAATHAYWEAEDFDLAVYEHALVQWLDAMEAYDALRGEDRQ